MNRWEFIKKIGLATVGLPLLSSFGLPKAYLSVADQEEREKFDFELYWCCVDFLFFIVIC